MIGDCRLPVPASIESVDLVVVMGMPRFAEVVAGILAEIEVQGAVIASESASSAAG